MFDLYSPVWFLAITASALLTCGLIQKLKHLFGFSLDVERGRFASIDGLRGLLAIGVFAHHAAIAYRFQSTGVWCEVPNSFYTFLGGGCVALFFMITGFLFGYKAIAKPTTVAPVPLLRSRLKRLMPMYLATYAVILLMVAVATHFTLRTTLLDVITSIFIGSLGGFFSLPKVNGYECAAFNASVTWSLFYEWRFYLCVPLFPILLKKPWQLGLLVAVFLCLSVKEQVWTQHVASFLIGLTGAQIAFYCHKGSKTDSFFRHPIFRISSIGLLVLCAFMYNELNWFGKISMLTPFFWAIVFDLSPENFLTSRAAGWLGAISYGVYLSHGILLSLFLWVINHIVPVTSMPSQAYWFLMIPLTVLLTTLCFVLHVVVERPFIKRSLSQSTSSAPTKSTDVHDSNRSTDLLVRGRDKTSVSSLEKSGVI